MNCPTCTRSVYNPYSRTDKQGNILEHCIDKCHDPYYVKPSTVWNWITTQRKKNRVFCKEQCPYKPKNIRDYHCKLCNLI